MADRKYYVFCDDNCKFETMSKEQILAAIDAAINKGIEAITDDGAFYEAVQETNHGRYIKFWIGTQAEYNALSNPDTNVLYIISDEDSIDDIMNDIQQLQSAVSNTADKIAEVEQKADEAETAANEANEIASAVQTLADEFDAEMQDFEADMEELTENVEASNELRERLKSWVQRTELLKEEDVYLNTTQEFELSHNYSDYTRIEIIIQTKTSSYYYTPTPLIYTAFVGTDKFYFPVAYHSGTDGYHSVNIVGHFSGNKFYIDEGHNELTMRANITINGIL